MLVDRDAIATIAVKNIKSARTFYEDTLGFKPAPGNKEPSVMSYLSGRTKLFVYESRYAGTNQATAATWDVGDSVTTVVQHLKTKGVVFEHYDMPGMTREGDIHVGGGSMKAAWFKDPDGNILAVVGT